ncbi:MAG: NUDIX hydrolase [Woeseiaceae bacterium]
MHTTIKSTSIILLLIAVTANAEVPEGYWGSEQTQPILDATQRVRLDPDLSHLSGAEFQALEELLAAGHIMNTLYEEQRHRGARAALAELQDLHTASGQSTETQNLLDLYYLSKGPIATTLDNVRGAILPTEDEQPGKNVYPYGLSRDEIDAFLAAHPEKSDEIKGLRTAVRRSTAENLAADLAALDAFPGVDALHNGLRERLETEPVGTDLFYAVPYALAYADELSAVRAHLNAAARLSRQDSPDFAAYLENKARDLLSGNYESGDASWVTGDFANLNIQIGSYETYDDALLGVKAFFSASILARDVEKSNALVEAIAGLQAIEDSLPYEHQKQVRRRIPVGVYRIIADFGQARGANTATILPNDANHARKYGRTILIRYNILGNPVLFANSKKLYDSVVDERFRDHLTADGKFNRTLWHEVGHYLGVSLTADGRTLGTAFADRADLLEELKSDLVSLHAAPALRASGYHDDVGLRAQYADGIRRTLQTVQPRPEQPYQNMQLMQFNFFMEMGLLEVDTESGLLTVNYERYHEVVGQMLEQVLQIHYSGDYDLADEFVMRWNYWDDKLHGRLATLIKESGIYRRTLVRYHALGD